jgi:hypothetical protein
MLPNARHVDEPRVNHLDPLLLDELEDVGCCRRRHFPFLLELDRLPDCF